MDTLTVALTAGAVFAAGAYCGALAMRAIWRPRYFRLWREMLRRPPGQSDPQGRAE